VHGDICTVCCGTEREVTVDCPFDCPFLQEARKHERAEINADDVPHRDVHITEQFLEEHQDLLLGAARSLAMAAFDTPGAVDSDVRDALEALVRTNRSLQSGLYYESRPDNAVASRIFTGTQAGLDEFRRAETEKMGMAHTRDSDVLTILVFLQRLEFDRQNGRRRGRAFLHYLHSLLEAEGVLPEKPPAPSLIVP